MAQDFTCRLTYMTILFTTCSATMLGFVDPGHQYQSHATLEDFRHGNARKSVNSTDQRIGKAGCLNLLANNRV